MADYRKIIKFGKNSLIISLPKDWTTRYRISPGDSVSVNQRHENLLITPLDRHLLTPTNDYTFNIDDQDITVTKRKILKAYMNNCDNITLRGKHLLNQSQEIRATIHNLVALEIIEESPRKIQAKCYLNMQDINTANLIRKIDAIIKTMLADLRDQFHTRKESEDLTMNFSQRDADINRLCYLLMRAVKNLLENPHEAKEHKIDASIINTWDMAQMLEKIGDEIKRFSRVLAPLNGKPLQDLLILLHKTTEHYNAIMKAYYRKDDDAADKLSLVRKTMNTDLERYQTTHEQDIPTTKALQRLRSLFYRVDELITVFD